MPQVDLRPIFTPSRHAEPSAKLPDPEDAKPVENGFRLRLNLTGAEWTNLAFVVCACLGAAFSAAYLFQGGELLQEVAGWPRELFIGRPVQINQAAPNVAAAAARAPERPGNDTGDPFSPTRKLLHLDPATSRALWPNSTPSSSPFAAASSAFRQLSAPAPGGDTLTRGLTQAAPNVAAQSTVTEQSSAVQTAAAAAQNADRQAQVASSRLTSASARTARVANATPRIARQSGGVRTARQSATNAKPSLLKMLFGSNTQRRVQSKTVKTNTKGLTGHAARTVRTASRSKSNQIAANRQALKNARTTTEKSGRMAVTQKLQVSRAGNSRTSQQSNRNPAAFQISHTTPASLRSSVPSSITQPASSAAAMRSFGSMHGFGNAGGMGFHGGAGFGHPGGR